MFEHMHRSWRDFVAVPPGRRFRRRYAGRRRARGGRARKFLSLILAALTMLTGVALMLVPGPGVLVFLAGAALAAQQSLTLARALDRLDVLSRAVIARGCVHWRQASPAVRMMLAVLPLLLVGVIGVTVVMLRAEL